jgi:hypothetical protein
VWVFDAEMGFRRRIIALTDHPEHQPQPGDPISRSAAELAAE